MSAQPQHLYIPGSAWLYFKIYCGVKTGDDLLLDLVKPVVDDLFETGTIHSWFFIRYTDPEPHLRVRFLLTNTQAIGSIMTVMHEHIKPFVETGLVHDLQLGSYRRELNRYGYDSITQAETLFCIDSTHALEMLANAPTDHMRLAQLCRWITAMIALFIPQVPEQITFLNAMSTQFREEFNASKDTTKQLNILYKKRALHIMQEPLPAITQAALATAVAALLAINKEQKQPIEITSLLASFVHMTINRTFKSQQRRYELLTYDFLLKQAKTKIAVYGKS
jgi:thiopeptide-type bacteriocin biosynthesis protein